MTRSDVRLDLIRTFLSELQEARGKYTAAFEWPAFGDWHRELYNFLQIQCHGQWPATVFENLRFKAKSRTRWDATEIDRNRIAQEQRMTPHMGSSPAPHDPLEAAESFARAADEVSLLLKSMIVHADDLLIARESNTKSQVPPASVTINAQRIDGSAIQIGTVGSSQATLKGSTLTLIERLRADSAGVDKDRRAEVEPLLTALSVAESDLVVEALVSAVAKVIGGASRASDQALGEWRAATGRKIFADPSTVPLEIIAKRLPGLRDELLMAQGLYRRAIEWRDFVRWKHETFTLLEGAFGSKSWQLLLFSSIEFQAPGGVWRRPEERPRGILSVRGIAQSIEDTRLEELALEADQRYFDTAIPRAFRVFEDVLSFVTASSVSKEQK